MICRPQRQQDDDGIILRDSNYLAMSNKTLSFSSSISSVSSYALSDEESEEDRRSRWKRLSHDMKTKRFALAAVAVGHTLVVLGGRNHNQEFSTVERYDGKKWTTLPPMPTPRQAFAAVVVDQRYLHVLGGRHDHVYLNTMDVLDLDTLEWTPKNSFSVPRAGCAAVVLLGGVILLLGGTNHQTARLNSVEMYHVDTQKWTTASPMGVARAYLMAAAVKDRVYVFGGIGAKDRVEMYQKEWTMLPSPMPTGRIGGAAAVMRGNVCLVGGHDGRGHELASAHLFDTYTHTYRTLAPMATPRVFCAAASTPNRVLVTGGCHDECQLQTTETLSHEKEALPPSVMDALTCPITGVWMKDPVAAADGYTYERAAMEAVLARVPNGQPVQSPVTGQTLPHRVLSPNISILRLIQQQQQAP